MPCSSYKYKWDDSEVCYMQPDDESIHGYGTCYCQGDETHCPLPYDDEVEEIYRGMNKCL